MLSLVARINEDTRSVYNHQPPMNSLLMLATADHPRPVYRIFNEQDLSRVVDPPNRGTQTQDLSAVVRLHGDHWQAASIRKEPSSSGGRNSIILFDPRQHITINESAVQRDVVATTLDWAHFASGRPETTVRMFSIGTQFDNMSGGDFAAYFIRQMLKHDKPMDSLHARATNGDYALEWLADSVKAAAGDKMIFDGPISNGPPTFWATNNLNILRSVSPSFLAKLLVHSQLYGRLLKQSAAYKLLGVPLTDSKKAQPASDLLTKFIMRNPVCVDNPKFYNPSINMRREKALQHIADRIHVLQNGITGSKHATNAPVPEAKRLHTGHES